MRVNVVLDQSGTSPQPTALLPALAHITFSHAFYKSFVKLTVSKGRYMLYAGFRSTQDGVVKTRLCKLYY